MIEVKVHHYCLQGMQKHEKRHTELVQNMVEHTPTCSGVYGKDKDAVIQVKHSRGTMGA